MAGALGGLTEPAQVPLQSSSSTLASSIFSDACGTSWSDPRASAGQVKQAFLGQDGDWSRLVRDVVVRDVPAEAAVPAEVIQVGRLLAILIDAIVWFNDFCGDGKDIRSEVIGFGGQGLQCLCQTLRQDICETLCYYRPETL